MCIFRGPDTSHHRGISIRALIGPRNAFLVRLPIIEGRDTTIQRDVPMSVKGDGGELGMFLQQRDSAPPNDGAPVDEGMVFSRGCLVRALP
jgi:hypothetical protein